MIVYDYHYPEGPKTYEFLLPAGPLPAEFQAIADHSSDPLKPYDFASVGAAWERKKSRLRHPLSKGFAESLDAYRPYSIVFKKQEFWIRIASSTEDLVANSLMIPFQPPLPGMIDGFRIEQFPELHEYLNEFRQLQSCIPPEAVPWGKGCEKRPKVVTCEDYWGGLRVKEWEGSLCVMVILTGDCVLFRQDGIFGLWDHGAVGHGDRLVRSMGDSSQFSKFMRDYYLAL